MNSIASVAMKLAPASKLFNETMSRVVCINVSGVNKTFRIQSTAQRSVEIDYQRHSKSLFSNFTGFDNGAGGWWPFSPWRKLNLRCLQRRTMGRTVRQHCR